MELLIGVAILFVLGLVLMCIGSTLEEEEERKKRILGVILEIVGCAFAVGLMLGYAFGISREENIIVFAIICEIVVSFGYIAWRKMTKDSFKKWELAVFIPAATIVALTCMMITNNYTASIEITEETSILHCQENELVSFENVPVQSTSGSISGKISGSLLYTDGEISGSITTSDKVQYMYINSDGDGEYDSAPTDKSKIRFIKESETPHIEVVTYQKQKITTNHNNGKITNEVESEWKEYIFYLPKSIFEK